jgi:glycosyltransferase involved in cell wall biosynthesis
MSDPLRVGFVLHVMQVAGAEVLTRELIRRAGPRIVPSVVCLDEVGAMGEEMKREGIDLVCFHRRPGRDWGVSRRMAAAIRERQLDIVHAHQYTPFFYSALAKLLLRRRPRLILTEHGRHYPDIVSRKRRIVNRVVLDRLADAVTACCHFSAKGLSESDGFRANRIEIIDNGIEVDRYGPRPTGESRTIIHVARHHPIKDQATLLRGFAIAAKVLPDIELLMVGDGPLRSDVESLSRDLGIADRVRFLGIRKDIPDLMRRAAIFALTSLSEAASLTLLEAMASGLPAVVTEVGGNCELVRHEQEGLLVPRGDASACAAAFLRLFGDAALARRLGDAGRQRAEERYRLEGTVNRYLSLYERLAR